MTMISKEAPYILRWTLQNWGMSEMERLVEPFNIYLRSQNAIYDLLKEAKIDVYQFEGLATQLSTNLGTTRTLNRIALMNRAKNNGNAILLDVKDKFEQKQITFAGLAEVWKENRIGLACAMRIPMTKLFGISAAGFNSGEDDIENYNAMVESEIREHVKPSLRKLIDMIVVHLFGQQFDFSFKFQPLRVLSSTDEETIKEKKYNRYTSMLDAGQLTDQEFAEICQMEGLVPIETEVARGAEPQPRRDLPGGMGQENEEETDEGPEQDA
jgi:phage-related protein (TIGR01555 family)